MARKLACLRWKVCGEQEEEELEQQQREAFEEEYQQALSGQESFRRGPLTRNREKELINREDRYLSFYNVDLTGFERAEVDLEVVMKVNGQSVLEQEELRSTVEHRQKVARLREAKPEFPGGLKRKRLDEGTTFDEETGEQVICIFCARCAPRDGPTVVPLGPGHSRSACG